MAVWRRLKGFCTAPFSHSVRVDVSGCECPIFSPRALQSTELYAEFHAFLVKVGSDSEVMPRSAGKLVSLGEDLQVLFPHAATLGLTVDSWSRCSRLNSGPLFPVPLHLAVLLCPGVT